MPDSPDIDAEQDREFENALRARSAAIPPPGFTGAVLRRVASEARPLEPLPVPAWLAALTGRCDPVVAGIGLVVLGAGLAVDAPDLAMWVDSGLAAPNPVVGTAAALLMTVLWFTTRTELS